MLNNSQISEEDQIPTYKLIILGLSSAGKTSLFTRYKFGAYENLGVITLVVDFHQVKTGNSKFQYYDTAGQDKYRAIVDSYYRGSDACLIIYDVTSIKSFEEINYYLNRIKQLVPDSLVFIIGTKCDLNPVVSPQLVRQHFSEYKHYVTSAKKNINVVETFKKIEAQLVDKKPKNLIKRKRQNVLLRSGINTKDKNRSQCCGENKKH